MTPEEARANAVRRAAEARRAAQQSATPPAGTTTNRFGQMVDPALQAAQDERFLAERPISSRAVEVMQGVPFVGEWIDEAVGMVSPGTAQNIRDASGAMERQRPGQSLALGMLGGVLSTAPLAVAGGGTSAANYIARGPSVAGRALRAGAVAAPIGAAEGAASFAGRADGGDRLRAAGQGAVVGGGLGAALGPVASMLGEGVAGLAKRIKRLDVRTISSEFGISKEAARAVKVALANEDFDSAMARLRQLGDDAMLADAGPSTAALLDASSATGGSALRITRNAVSERSAAVGARLPPKLNEVLGTPRGIKTTAREISQSTARVRQAAYDRAFAMPIDYAGPGRAIEDVLARVPAGTLRRAISEANDAMQEAGLRNMQIMAEIADDGSVTFRQMPNVQQLDQIKRALDDIARDADNFGRPTGAALRAGRLARDLRDAIGDAVPDYRRALKLGGDKIKMDQGLDLGRKLLWKNTTVEDVREFVGGFGGTVPVDVQRSIRQGLRDTIENTLSNVRRTITDPDTNAREAMQVVKELSSRANRDKIRLVLGDSKADQLLNEMDRMATALSLRAAVAENSKTAIRSAVRDEVSSLASPGAARQVLGNAGNPLDATRDITRYLAGTDKATITEAERRIFEQIAGALTSIRGEDARRALSAVRRAMAGQPLRDVEADLIGRVLGVSGASGLHQGLTRPLEPQPR